MAADTGFDAATGSMADRRAGTLPQGGLGPAVSAWTAALIGLAIGAAYGLWLLGWDFVSGSAAFWQAPRGLSGGEVDIRTALSGYYWFVQDAWRWPLMEIGQAGGDLGTNAAMMDPVPLAGFVAKVIRSTTGATVNLFSWWIWATFALNAAGLAVLVHALGERRLVGVTLAAVLGALAPLIHFRFGHVGHASHFLFLFALAVYFGGQAWRRPVGWSVAGLIGLCALAATINLYLYVICAAIAAAFLLRAWAAGRLGLGSVAAGLVGTLAVAVAVLWALGLLQGGGLTTKTVPFGYGSMNLMSWFWPQTSGLFGWTGVFLLTRGSIGATPGQYEGYAYLGGGALLLLGVAAVRAVLRTGKSGGDRFGWLRRQWPLVAALAVLTVWAVSNQVYFGPAKVLSYPLPGWLLDTVLSWFRASGRFFWPVAWLLTAMAVAGSLRGLGWRRAAALAVVALALQWGDVSIWRGRLSQLAQGPGSSAFGSAAASRGIEAEIAARGRVAVIPSMDCNSSGGGDYDSPASKAAAEVQLMAARANAVMPEIAIARGHLPSCEGDRHGDLAGIAGRGVLVAVHDVAGLDRTAEARTALDCRSFAVGEVCTARVPGVAPGVAPGAEVPVAGAPAGPVSGGLGSGGGVSGGGVSSGGVSSGGVSSGGDVSGGAQAR